MNAKINIVFEDENLVVVEKPSGVVVHPGAGHKKNTLVDWLRENYPQVKNKSWIDNSRPGIVHRLDKDTSGLMILAKNPETLAKLQEMIERRQIKKTYLALTFGHFEKESGEIKSFVGRDPNARRQQISRGIFFDFEPGKKREAITRYRVLKEYYFNKEHLSLVEADLETGRTHQIRVQFKSLGHPVIGDPLYNIKNSRKISKALGLERQFLHSAKLAFGDHQFESKLPANLEKILLTILRHSPSNADRS